MRPLSAAAFAPAVISNFFAIHDEALRKKPPDYSRAGATGGGFTLSKGVYSRASAVRGSKSRLTIVVDGDPAYPADTTRRAVSLLLNTVHEPVAVELVQTVEVPIGAGFGTSSASALSAVMAIASALELGLDKERVASFAHQADIMQRTGLGTVSSTYDQSGAAIIVKPGGPGVARLRRVEVPAGHMVVTASLERQDRGSILSSARMRTKINRLGEAALERASDLRFESLLAAGSEFASGLGLMTPELRSLVDVALHNGAVGASQNMIGNAIHAVVPEGECASLSSALAAASRKAEVEIFDIGGAKARVLAEDFPRFTHA